MNFNQLKINEKILKRISEIGFEEMMPIQEKSIPVILNGDNVIGEAETGTGKTGAFVIPVLDKIDFSSKKVECLIVTPTRELAMQIVNEIKKIGKYMNPTYATLVGGMSIRDQVNDLRKNPSIIVGTLGRINDHIRNKKLDLSGVKYFILDEADEMLKEGFKEDITIINNLIPENKQTLLFSATISKQILNLSKSIMSDYTLVSVKDENTTSTNIDQYYIVMKEKNKFSTLAKILDVDNPSAAIIFGRTKRRVDELSESLNECGYKAIGIHGDLSQQQRNSAIKQFKDKRANILVATDVAARGLDIEGITHVYNFDLPQEVEFYIHRIGRTGRAKKHGVSYSFIKDGEINHIRKIEKETKVTIVEKSIPTSQEVWEARNVDVINSIDKKLSEIDTTRTLEFSNKLIEEYGADKLVSILIENLSKNKDVSDVALTGEPPVVVKNKGQSYKRSDRGGSRNRRTDRRPDRRNDRNRRDDRNKRDDRSRSFKSKNQNKKS